MNLEPSCECVPGPAQALLLQAFMIGLNNKDVHFQSLCARHVAKPFTHSNPTWTPQLQQPASLSLPPGHTVSGT